MPNVDLFESVFRRASRELFKYRLVQIESALLISDLEKVELTRYGGKVRKFLDGLPGSDAIRWKDVPGEEFQSPSDLLELVEKESPGLVCTYRNLHSQAWKFPYSLGVHLDVLTQHTDYPILVLPHPLAQQSSEAKPLPEDWSMKNTNTVMTVTGHLTGDHSLVNYAVAFTEAEGKLYLVHIEDELVFQRYLDAISKIPAIDTDSARNLLRSQLLHEPREYIRSCRDELISRGLPLKVENNVAFGEHLAGYKKLIEEHHIDLLVMHTKEKDQLAMHGIAYSLAVELRQTPLLMI